jgi:hypothetical protein
MRLERTPIKRRTGLDASNRRSSMKRTDGAVLAVAAIAVWLALVPAHAAPPTVTPSPGYDARLQEQRAATSTVQQPVAPVVTPAPPRRGKKTRAH